MRIEKPRAPNPLIKYHHITSKFIWDNPDIFVIISDKGNTTIIMHTEKYNQEVKNLLNDSNTCKYFKHRSNKEDSRQQ